jgi:hypothetical protein
MSLFGSIDQANNSPKYGAQNLSVGSGPAAQVANTTALFQNTTSGAFIPHVATGVFGVSNVHMANTGGEAEKINHTGWNLRIEGTGGVANVVVTDGGLAYDNTDLVEVSGGTVNAAGTLVTNSTGGITSVVITTPGEGFINVGTVAVTNSSGGASTGNNSAAFTVSFSGRAGRVTYETLVAGGITAGTNTAILPL